MIPVGKTMGAQAYTWQALRWLAATAAAALTTFLLAWLGANSTTAGMVFLVLVVWWAAQSGTRSRDLHRDALRPLLRLFLSAAGAHLSAHRPQAWVAMGSFVASCLVVSRVAERARRQTQQAKQRQADVERLYALSQEMMLFEDAERLLHDLPGLIGRIFILKGVVLYVRDQDHFYSSTAEAPASVQAHMRAITEGLNPTMAPLAGYHTAALMLGLKALGALAWQPDDAFARGCRRRERAGVDCGGAIHRHGNHGAHGGGPRRRTAAHRADRFHDSRAAHSTHLDSRSSHHALESEGLDEDGRSDMARIIDEEAARLDLLIGESVEMAEIDANVVQVKMSPQHPARLA